MIQEQDPRYLAAKEAAAVVHAHFGICPKLAIVLGSGLGKWIEQMAAVQSLSYADIPHCPKLSAPGHEGRLYLYDLDGQPVLALSGRAHFYEGHAMASVVFLMRMLAVWGVSHVFLTNAAGGISSAFKPGDLMVIDDHIGLWCPSPLIGPNIEALGPRFNDQTAVYDPEWRDLADRVAAQMGLQIHHGVYAYTTGPSYETPAEIRALGVLGAHAVGMSTVPEAICAHHAGMRVFGLSCITNLAAGLSQTQLNHEEVLAAGAEVADRAIHLIKGLIANLDQVDISPSL